MKQMVDTKRPSKNKKKRRSKKEERRKRQFKPPFGTFRTFWTIRLSPFLVRCEEEEVTRVLRVKQKTNFGPANGEKGEKE